MKNTIEIAKQAGFEVSEEGIFATSKLSGDSAIDISEKLHQFHAIAETEIEKLTEKQLNQILHDPENQPSQYGTVPLEWYENLENKLERYRFKVEEVVDELSGSYANHAIRKKLQEALE